MKIFRLIVLYTGALLNIAMMPVIAWVFKNEPKTFDIIIEFIYIIALLSSIAYFLVEQIYLTDNEKDI